MISYMPELYPNELVYSWFCRYYVHSGCMTHREALRNLLKKRCNNPSKEFIGQLHPDAKAVIEKIISMETLVLHHTMFPQYARFIPLADRKTALHRLGHDFPDAHQLFSVLPRGENEQYLKYCPVCVREDRTKYGEAYWHRKHQIRNIGVCTKHRCQLKDSVISAKSEQSYTLSPAEFCVEEEAGEGIKDALQLEYASFLEAVFDAPMDMETDTPVNAILYRGLKQTGYIKSSGKMRCTARLTEDLNVYFQNLGLSEIVSLSQIQRIATGACFDFSAICQMAFFIGLLPGELTRSVLTASQIQEERDSHDRNKGQAVDWETYDRKTLPKMEKICGEIYDGTASEIGRPERVSEREVYRKLGLAGHSLENMPECRAVLERYAEPYPESWARKLVWAYGKLLDEREGAVCWSDVRKLAGVKKARLGEVMQFLEEYADEGTVRGIMELVKRDLPETDKDT